MMGKSRRAASACVLSACALGAAILASAAAAAEYNPVRVHPVSIGPEADRLIIGFRAPSADPAVDGQFARPHAANLPSRASTPTVANDMAGLAARTRLKMVRSRQLTSNAHVIYLEKTLYGADVASLLDALRADPAVEYADVDRRRYAHGTPDDPLFIASSNATGQWYMMPPSAAGTPLRRMPSLLGISPRAAAAP